MVNPLRSGSGAFAIGRTMKVPGGQVSLASAEVLAAFEANATRTRSFTATVVRGANHSFVGHERALAEGIVRWIAREAR